MFEHLRRIPDLIMVPAGWGATLFAAVPDGTKTILPWVVGVPTAILTALKIYDWIESKIRKCRNARLVSGRKLRSLCFPFFLLCGVLPCVFTGCRGPAVVNATVHPQVLVTGATNSVRVKQQGDVIYIWSLRHDTNTGRH